MPSSSTAGPSGTQDPWNVNYVNDEHIQAFTRALDFNDTAPHDNGDISPSSPRSPPAPLSPVDGPNDRDRAKFQVPETWKYGPDNGVLASSAASRVREGGVERVEKLTATSDFAPIHQRVSRRKTVTSQGWTYHLIRWPLLAILFTIISFEFNAYVITRQIVNVFEYIVAWRGKKGKLRQDLRQAKTYEEWKAAARRMDRMLGFDEWKETEDDGYYDYFLVKRVRRTLTKLRAANDTRGLMDALAVCVRPNFAGTEGVKMYSETFFGTKKLVEAHIDEVVASIDYVRAATNVSLEEKRVFFRGINKNYGSSALCLSGGASFGYYHFGVIKAFLEADLLPRVVTGTSAGGLVAALLCTRTNDELKVLLVPELADKITACEDSMPVWIKRWWKTGARFSAVDWVSKAMFFTMGSLTFKEAYERTGRALNVTVVPSDRHSPTILLNHLTAPNCIIWSAIIASAAVPGILNPVVLMAKDRNGQVKPHNLGGSRFKDGSLREDIPLGSLHAQFNCNFSIVSQTNPHIHLFFFAPRGSVGRPVAHRKGKGWRGGFILSALESYIKLDLNKHFKVIRDLDLLPQILQSDWSGVFLQRFSGDLTLTPRSTAGDWFRLLSDPDRTQLQRMLEVGEKVSWPSLHMVRNRMAIERAVFRGRSEIRAATNRERTTNDAALTAFKEHENLTNQVPIESDADAGFASRTRRVKTHRSVPAAAEAFGNPPQPSSSAAAAAGVAGSSNSVRRRRIFPRIATGGGVGASAGNHRRRPSEVVFDPPPPRLSASEDDDEEDDDDEDDNSRTVRGHSTTSAPATAAASPAAKGTYAALGDTFRNVRATSLSAFSPFRSRLSSFTTGPSGSGSGGGSRDGLANGHAGAGVAQRDVHGLPSSTQYAQGQTGLSTGAGLTAQTRRSQSSISRWFGGGDESSGSDDDPAGLGGGIMMGPGTDEGSARSRSPDDFGYSAAGRVLMMSGDDESSDEDDDVEGAGVIRASGPGRAGGEGVEIGGEAALLSAGRAEYSPPQQDPGQ